MRKIVTAFVAVCCVSVASMAMAAGPKWQYFVTVKAADTSYTEVPVSITVPAPPGTRSARLRELGGEEVTCDVHVSSGQARVTWILRDLQKGAWRRYRLQFRPEHPYPMGSGVQLTWHGLGVTVQVGGNFFTSYYFGNTPKPFSYPVIGPTGRPVTRAYPMEKLPGESSDHPHHRSFWFAFGDVNGQDFWGESPKSGRIVQRFFEAHEIGLVTGRIRAGNDWIANDGTEICEDVREFRFYDVKQGRLMDFEVTQGPVEFGDTKEGMMAFRVASSMEVTRGKGHIVNSEGVTDKDAWGKRANWCDYWGPIEDKTVGIAIFDHPGNFGHPTYWHVRDYGLFAANPFGVRDFVGKEAPSGAHTLAKGDSLTFRYRIYIHEGDAQAANVSSIWEQYAHPPLVRVH
jgi:hypothetical protein